MRVLQAQADGGSEPQYVPSEGRSVTLEHILPANPGTGWTGVKPEDAKANFNRLGNQALLAGSVNSRIGNAEYRVKKKALKASPFSLTKRVAKFSSWGIPEINQHQEYLSGLAVLAWPLRVK